MGRNIIWRIALTVAAALILLCGTVIGQSVELSQSTSEVVGSSAVAGITDNTDAEVTVMLDWSTGTITLSVLQNVPADIHTFSNDNIAASHMLLKRVRDNLPELIYTTLEYIALNQQENVQLRVSELPDNRRFLERIASFAQVTASDYSAQYKRSVVTHTIPLYQSIAAPFVLHTTPDAVPVRYEWTPTTEYTGIVILAHETLPIRGTQQTGLATPALQPTIFDEQYRRVVDVRMVQPSIAKNRGMVQYTTSLVESDWSAVVGPMPIRILARGLEQPQGSNIIIDDNSAAQLLSTHHNRALIAQGKILVVLQNDLATHSFSTSLDR